MIATRPAARPGRPGVARYLVSIAYELRRSRGHTQRTLSHLVRVGLLEREHGRRIPSSATETGWSTEGATRYHLTGQPAGLLWATLERPPAYTGEDDGMPRRRQPSGPQYRPAKEVIADMRDGRPPPARVYWTPDNPIFHSYMYCRRHDIMYRDCRECTMIALAIIRGNA